MTHKELVALDNLMLRKFGDSDSYPPEIDTLLNKAIGPLRGSDTEDGVELPAETEAAANEIKKLLLSSGVVTELELKSLVSEP